MKELCRATLTNGPARARRGNAAVNTKKTSRHGTTSTDAIMSQETAIYVVNRPYEARTLTLSTGNRAAHRENNVANGNKSQIHRVKNKPLNLGPQNSSVMS